MKVGIATTLSVAGVLAAGAAAFALNTAVLSDSPSGTIAAANIPASTDAADGTVPVTPAPGGGVTATGGMPITPEAIKVSATVTTYKVGEAGNVVIDTSSGAVSVTDVVPAAGWTAEPARAGANGVVKVHFVKGHFKGTTWLEFTAQMTNGTVAVSVATENRPVPTAPKPGVAPTIPRSVSGGGDHDDDDHEEHHGDDDHEDEDDD